MMCDRVCVWHAVLVNPYCYMYETVLVKVMLMVTLSSLERARSLTEASRNSYRVDALR